MRNPTREEFAEHWNQFQISRAAELQSWKDNDCFELVEYDPQIHSEANILSSRWVDTFKLTEEGNILKHKSRLVARGYEDERVDLKTDSPTSSKLSCRLGVKWLMSKGYPMYSIDIRTAFLQGKQLSENVYMHLPEDVYQILHYDMSRHYIWKLKRAVYGMKDSPRQWFDELISVLKSLGMKQSSSDLGLFSYSVQGETHGVCVIHVDDILCGGSNLFMTNVIDKLKKRFAFGRQEQSDFTYCGIHLQQVNDTTFLSQSNYSDSIETIVVPNWQSHRPLSKFLAKKYRSVLGALSWISLNSRPDFAFMSSSLASRQTNPTIADLRDLNRAIKALKSNNGLGIEYTNFRPTRIIVHSDSSLGNLENFGTQHGYVVLLANENGQTNLVDWASRKLKRVAHSTLTAETLGVVAAVDAAIHSQNLWKHISGQEIPIDVITDCKSLVDSVRSTKPVSEKALIPTVQSLRDRLRLREINSISHILTSENYADAMTKARSSKNKIRELLGSEISRQVDTRPVFSVFMVNHKLKAINDRKKSRTQKSIRDKDITQDKCTPRILSPMNREMYQRLLVTNNDKIRCYAKAIEDLRGKTTKKALEEIQSLTDLITGARKTNETLKERLAADADMKNDTNWEETVKALKAKPWLQDGKFRNEVQKGGGVRKARRRFRSRQHTIKKIKSDKMKQQPQQQRKPSKLSSSRKDNPTHTHVENLTAELTRDFGYTPGKSICNDTQWTDRTTTKRQKSTKMNPVKKPDEFSKREWTHDKYIQYHPPEAQRFRITTSSLQEFAARFTDPKRKLRK